MADHEKPLTGEDLEALGEVKLELVEGDLHVNGGNHGHGTRARLLLTLLNHADLGEPMRATDDCAARGEPSDSDVTSDTREWLERRQRRDHTRKDALVGEVVRILSHADESTFASIYAAAKAAQAVQDQAFARDLNTFWRPRKRHGGRDQAGKVLSLFASIGVQPYVDYFCNGGRTRVLELSIPIEHESIVDLCRRVLAEVYSMRRGDVLDYHPLKRADVPPAAIPGGFWDRPPPSRRATNRIQPAEPFMNLVPTGARLVHNPSSPVLESCDTRAVRP